ncbi:hypothetical protein [Singulisphaera sp. PoT]|uniref:hypothetical protein n=1 Tax=Singulisphaera sp. PoT TaxID=3411797 RepID=UPI003BF4BBC3
MEFAGDFEIHITIEALGETEVEAVLAWAEQHGLKFHHIVLARGLTPSQPMITRSGRGVLSGQIAEANELCRLLAGSGLVATRVKVEAAPWNEDVPLSDEAAAAHPGRHFEHHVKLALPPEADLQALGDLAEPHGAHLSRNARRSRPDGLGERFVTQRCHRCGRATASARLRLLETAIRSRGHVVLSVEEEYVVHDTNPGVDAGWLEPGRHPCPTTSGDSSSD